MFHFDVAPQKFNSFLIVYLRTWNSLMRKHFYQNFSNLISKLSDVICNRFSCISLNFTFIFNAEQENQFSHATRCWYISNELSMCCRFLTNWLLRKLASRRRGMQHNIQRYFFSSNNSYFLWLSRRPVNDQVKGRCDIVAMYPAHHDLISSFTLNVFEFRYLSI